MRHFCVDVSTEFFAVRTSFYGVSELICWITTAAPAEGQAYSHGQPSLPRDAGGTDDTKPGRCFPGVDSVIGDGMLCLLQVD